MNAAFDVEVDATGLSCPWPVLKLRRALHRDVAVGGLVKVIATDRGALVDFRTFCARTGNELVQVEQDKRRIQLYVRRKC